MDEKNVNCKNLPNTTLNDNNIEGELPFVPQSLPLQQPPPPYIEVGNQNQNNNITYILPPNNIQPNHFILSQGPPILNNYSLVHHNNYRRQCNNYQHTRYPTTLYCYKCNQYVLSLVYYEKGKKYNKNLLILLLFCLICPPAICIIPILLLTDSLKDSVHKCPCCGTIIGIHVV